MLHKVAETLIGSANIMALFHHLWKDTVAMESAVLASGQTTSCNTRLDGVEAVHKTCPDGVVIGANDRPEGQMNEETHVVASASDSHDRPQ